MSSKKKEGWTFNPRKSSHFATTIYRLSKIVPYVLSKHEPRVLDLDTFSTVEGIQSRYEATQKLEKNEYEMLGLNRVIPKRAAYKEFYNTPDEFDDVVSKDQYESVSSDDGTTDDLLDDFLNVIPSKVDEDDGGIGIGDPVLMNSQTQYEPQVEEDEILYIGDTCLNNSKKKTLPHPSKVQNPELGWVDVTDMKKPNHTSSFSKQSQQENMVFHPTHLSTSPQIHKTGAHSTCMAKSRSQNPTERVGNSSKTNMHSSTKPKQIFDNFNCIKNSANTNRAPIPHKDIQKSTDRFSLRNHKKKILTESSLAQSHAIVFNDTPTSESGEDSQKLRNRRTSQSENTNVPKGFSAAGVQKDTLRLNNSRPVAVNESGNQSCSGSGSKIHRETLNSNKVSTHLLPETHSHVSKENYLSTPKKRPHLKDEEHRRINRCIGRTILQNDTGKPGMHDQTSARHIIDDSPWPKQRANSTLKQQKQTGSTSTKTSHFSAETTRDGSQNFAQSPIHTARHRRGRNLAWIQAKGTNTKMCKEVTVVHENLAKDSQCTNPSAHEAKNITYSRSSRKRPLTSVKDVITSKSSKDNTYVPKSSQCTNSSVREARNKSCSRSSRKHPLTTVRDSQYTNSNVCEVKNQVCRPTYSDSTVGMRLRSRDKKAAEKGRQTSVVPNRMET